MTENIFSTLGGWTCPKHGYWSSFSACAWPNCPHGVAVNEFEEICDFTEKKSSYSRISWTGHEGELFYDWKEDSLPSWSMLGRAINFFKLQVSGKFNFDQMFHYTSAAGALAIIESESLRFSDYAFLNDTREISHGLDIVRAVLNNMSIQDNSEALTKLKESIMTSDPFNSYNIYTASFSSDSNSLSQFRLYGSVALGFDTKPISFGSVKGDFYLGNVIYDQKIQVKLIETFLGLVKQSEDMDKSFVGDDNKTVYTEYLISHLLPLLALFKNPAFCDEKEVRLLYSEQLETMDWLGLDIAERKFRESDGLIIPYTDTIEMARSSRKGTHELVPKTLPLNSVVIGPTPHANVLANGMRDLLSSKGYHDVEVTLSEAPLRC